MGRKFQLFVLLGLLAATTRVFAADYQVVKVSESGERAIVSQAGGELKVGEALRFTDEFSETCTATVIKSEGTAAVLDLAKCSNKKSVRSGSVFGLGASVTTASPTTPMSPAPSAATSPTSLSHNGPTIDESWYTLWGLGFSGVNYANKDLENAWDNAEN